MEVFPTVISALICVVVGSALGGTARYFVSGVVARRLGETFPWGTLIVNASGCFAMGLIGAFVTARGLSSIAIWPARPGDHERSGRCGARRR